MCFRRIINCFTKKTCKEKLAIIILGDSDTGKSSLLKELVKNHSTNNNGNDVEKANKGTRKLFFNSDKSLTQDAYIIFSSLSEDEKFENKEVSDIKQFINQSSDKPFDNIKVIIYPDHPNTDIYEMNKAFLENEKFKVIEFEISDSNKLKHWHYNESELVEKDVEKRVEDIIKCVKGYSKDKLN